MFSAACLPFGVDRPTRDLLLPCFRAHAIHGYSAEAGRRAMLNPELRARSAAAGYLAPTRDPEVARATSVAYWSNPEARKAQSERKRRLYAQGKTPKTPSHGCRSPAEYALAAQLREQGCQVFQTGWPDLLVRYPDGQVKAIEVKSGSDHIRPNQQALHEVLRSIGLPVEEVRLNVETSDYSHRVGIREQRKADQEARQQAREAARVVRMKKEPKDRRKVTDDALRSVQGLPATEAARRLGVHPLTVLTHRKRLGLPAYQPQRTKKVEFNLSSVDGLSAEEAGRRLGVRPALISKRRREAGYPSAIGNSHIASRYPAKRDEAA